MKNNNINSEILNDLIKIISDRITGYEESIKELAEKDSDLRTLFSDMIKQSISIRSNLEVQVKQFWEMTKLGITDVAKSYKAWIAAKTMFSGLDRKSTLNSCEFGEDVVQHAYKIALSTTGLSHTLRDKILMQKKELEFAYNRIRSIRSLEHV